MDISIVKLFPDNLIKALCDTFIHSLWQGLLLAAITGLIIVFTRKSTPARRYNLLIAALLLFAAGAVCTFVIELNKTQANTTPLPHTHAFTTGNAAPIQLQQQQVIKTSFTTNITAYLNKNASTIVLIWFMIVCARCLQLVTGLQGIYYLKRKSIFKIDEAWQNRVLELSKNLGIRKAVKIAESGIAKVPMVIGHLKPLILIPVGLLTAIPPEEIEAILVHELAHIRRSDYLVNLLQSLLEIVFFFNPAVLWISALIKTERENCCDDIAVAQSSNKVNYIRALVSCQEYNLSSPAYAMALKGNKNHLKDRVRRIISNSNHSLNKVEKSILAICLVATGLFTVAFTNAAHINKLVTTTRKAVNHIIKTHDAQKPIPAPKDTVQAANEGIKKQAIAKKDTTINRFKIFDPADFNNGTRMKVSNNGMVSYLVKEKGVLFQVNLHKNEVVSLQVDGKIVQQDQLPAYQKIIDKVLGKGDQGSEIIDAADQRNKAALNEKLAALDSSSAKLSGTRAKLSGRLGDLNTQGLNEKRDMAIADSVNQVYKKSKKDYKKSAISPYYPKSAYSKPYGNDVKSNYDPKSPDYKPYTKVKEDERRDKVINEMISDGIISTKDNLSFKISTSEFIVNGKKQPDAVYQKYRAKYVKIVGNGEWSWMYNYDTEAKRETSSTIATDNPPGKH